MVTISETKSNHRNHLIATDPVIRLCRRQQAFKLSAVPSTDQGFSVFEPFPICNSMAHTGIKLMIALMLTVMVTLIKDLIASFLLLLLFTLYINAVFLSVSHLPYTCGGVIQSLSLEL